MNVELTPDQLQLIKSILLKYMPEVSKVWVFGSRARGNAKKFSDLDLALDYHGKEFPHDIMVRLANDFEESNLPFKVDLIDWNSISPEFKKNIQMI